MNLTELRDKYLDTKPKEGNFLVMLKFEYPVTLVKDRRHYSEPSKNHLVKRMTFANAQKYANPTHTKEEIPVYLYYTPKRLKSSGYHMPDSLIDFEIIKDEKDYSSQWRNIAKKMKANGINLDMVENIEKHLSGEREHIQGCQNYWKKTHRPRLMDFSDVTNGLTLEEMKNRMTSSQYSTMRYRREIDGMKRDRSIELYISSDGSLRFNGASEYSGCGNGDYYIMFDASHGFYAESD